MDIWDAPEVTFQTGGGLVNYPRLLSSMDNPFHRLVSSQHLCSLSEGIYLYAVPGYLSYTEIRQE